MSKPEERKDSRRLYRCDVIESLLDTKEYGAMRVYGLALYNRIPRLAGRKSESCIIYDISEDYDKVRRLKRLIDEEGLFPVNLQEVVEDYLS